MADEDRFSLDRSIGHLAGYSDPGGYPGFQAGEIVREGAPALARTRYLLAGLEKRNPETAGPARRPASGQAPPRRDDGKGPP